MSSYAELLEECTLEESYANETFSSLGSYLESLTDFVNEDVNFEVTLSLDEATSDDEKKVTPKKIGAAIVNGLKKLKEKLIQFVKNIGEAIKRFVAKAKVAIAEKGNKAMKAIIEKRGPATITKDIQLTEIKGGAAAVKSIFDKGISAAGTIYTNLMAAANSLDGVAKGGFKDVDDANGVLKAFSNPITSSDIARVAKKSFVKKDAVAVYNEYAGAYFDVVEKMLPTVESTVKDAQKTANDVAKKIGNIDYGNDNNLKTDAIKELSTMSNACMKISTYCINYAASVLTMAVKNSAKIALGAGAKAKSEEQIAKEEKKAQDKQIAATKNRLQAKKNDMLANAAEHGRQV